MKQVKLLAYTISGIFLAIHVLMFVIFQACGVFPMACFNVASILFYIWMLYLVSREYFRPLVLLTFFEICVHMFAAIVCVGFNVGFQITLIGICVILFYSEYVARSMNLKYLRSITIAPAALIFYLAGYLFSVNRKPPYILPIEVTNFFQISLAVIVFVIAILILQLFVYVSTRYQEVLSNEVFHDKLTGLPNRYYMTDFF